MPKDVLGKQTLCQLSYSRSGDRDRSPCGENLPLEPGDGRAGGAGKAQGDLTPDIFVLIIALQTGIIGAALYGLTFAAMILWAARGPTQGRALVLAMLGIFVTSSVLSSSPGAPIFATTIWILILASAPSLPRRLGAGRFPITHEPDERPRIADRRASRRTAPWSIVGPAVEPTPASRTAARPSAPAPSLHDGALTQRPGG